MGKASFGSHFDIIWETLSELWRKFSALFQIFSRKKGQAEQLFRSLFFMYVFHGFEPSNCAPSPPGNEVGGTGEGLWRPRKTPHSRKSMDSVREWDTFAQIRSRGPLGKGKG